MKTSIAITVMILATLTGSVVSTASAQITIPTVVIGNPGNPSDPTSDLGFGSVEYTYKIGQTEVTNAQYTAFLNAKAASDPLGLYSTSMAGAFGGIIRLGTAGQYTYETATGRGDNPVNFVTFWDAARFANWLHNGQGNGDTETGAYTLTASAIASNTVARNAGWLWAITSENEWYKAAYYQPASDGGDTDNYWLYPTASNTAPTLGFPPTGQANYGGNFSPINNTIPVGLYAANFYGTFDMAGNVFEWNETVLGVFFRGYKGGAFSSATASNMQAPFRNVFAMPAQEFNQIGFRVSQAQIDPVFADGFE